MSDMVDLVRVLTSATGNSTPITLGARYSDLFMTPADAGAVDGRAYTYLIVDANNWELGKGVYTASGTTLARTTILASRISGTLGTTRITLSGTAQVRFVQAAEDIGGVRGTRTVTGATDTIAVTDLNRPIVYNRATAIAVSLAQAGTAGFLDGWATWVRNIGVGTATITPATSTIGGGATLALLTGQGAFIWSDGTNYNVVVCASGNMLVANNLSDVASAATARTNIGAMAIDGAAGFVMANGTLIEGHASNAVSFAVKTLAGNNPSASDPVDFYFPTNIGTYARVRVTATLSITIPSGGAMGASNGVPFRIWIGAMTDGINVELFVRNCADANGISGFRNDNVASTTALGGGSAKVSYSATARAWYGIVLGYAEWSSGLTTAGTWNASPTLIALKTPSMKLPGEVIRWDQVSSSTATNTTSTTYVTSALTYSAGMQSPANAMRISFSAPLSNTDQVSGARARLHRSGTAIGPEAVAFNSVSGQTYAHMAGTVHDLPGSASPTYDLRVKTDIGTKTATLMGVSATGTILVEEIQG